MDYGSVLHAALLSLFNKLQLVANAVPAPSQEKKCAVYKPTLVFTLHHVPVKFHIEHKATFITFKALRTAPVC